MTEPQGNKLRATEQVLPVGSSADNTAPVVASTMEATTAPALTTEQQYRARIAFLETEIAQLRANSSADHDEDVQSNSSIMYEHRIKVEDNSEPESQTDFEPVEPETTVPTATAPTKTVRVKQKRRKPPQHQRQGPGHRVSKTQHKPKQNTEAVPTGESYHRCNNCRKWGHTQHQCREPKRVRQQTATQPKTQGAQQTRLALPSRSQTPQRNVAPPNIRDEMARGQRPSFESQNVMSRGPGYDDRYSDHMSARRHDDFNSRMTDVTQRAPVYESSWNHGNRPPPFEPRPFGPPPHEPSRGYNPPFEPARGYDMPLRSGPIYDSRPSVDGRFPPWQTGSYPGPYGYQDSGSFPPRAYPNHDGYQRDPDNLAYGRYPNDYDGRGGRGGRGGHPPDRW